MHIKKTTVHNQIFTNLQNSFTDSLVPIADNLQQNFVKLPTLPNKMFTIPVKLML